MPGKKNDSSVTERPLKMFEIIRKLHGGGMEDSMETLQLRAKKWAELYPSGEPMFKRPESYRVIIRSKEVAAILGLHLRTAQKMLQNTRAALGLPEHAYVSVKSFCFINNFDEDDIRKSLAALFGDRPGDDEP